MANTSAARPLPSARTQALATACAIAGAVALPQLFHVMGMISGTGTALGETFLPMHLPVMLAGLFAGPYVGLLSGFLGPVASHLMTGMPGSAMLPFMMVELATYGLVAGLLRDIEIPTILKVLAIQVAGRAVRAAAILFSAYVLGSDALAVSVIWTSVATGVFGLALQWVLIPLIVYRVKGGTR